MAPANSPTTPTADREIVITRLFDAPRELVFEAWTDPKTITQWWGPKGFTTTSRQMEVKAGGVWVFTMHGPDGRDYPNKISYREVRKPSRLVFTHGTGEPNDPNEFETIVTFAQQSGKTKLTMRSIFPTAAQRDYVVKEFHAIEGGNQTLDRLGEYLASRGADKPQGLEFVISRTFDAPRDLVWKAFTEKERLAQWWGPKGFAVKKASLDLRPGGVFHYGLFAPNGAEMWGKFTFREVTPQDRLVYVTSFSDEQGGTNHGPFFDGGWPLEVLSTTTFVDLGGKTILTHRSVPINATAAEHRTFEGNFESMQRGYTGTWDQLDTYLAKEQGRPALVISRFFDAPRELVYRSWTDPKMMARWWGPKHFTCPHCKMDLRVGGKYLFCMRSPEGQDFWSTGTYREIVSPSRLVMTDSFADAQGNIVDASHYGMSGIPRELQITVSFEDVSGHTLMTLRHDGFPEGQHRELAAEGWNESLDKLADAIAKP